MLRTMGRAGLSKIGPDYGAEEVRIGLLPDGGADGGGIRGQLDGGYAPRSRSWLLPVARCVPDVVVLALLGSTLAWCWVSSWLFISTGAQQLTWNASVCQLAPLSAVCALAGLKIYLLRPLEDELSHFKQENGKFKENLGRMGLVSDSLKAENEQFKSRNEELQLAIGDLENVRGVIETYAVKTQGDVGQMLEEVKKSVCEQLLIQQRTKRLQERIRGLVNIQLNSALLSSASEGQPGAGALSPDEFQQLLAMLESSDSSSTQDLAGSLSSARSPDGSVRERSAGRLMKSTISRLMQLDKDEDADLEKQGEPWWSRLTGGPASTDQAQWQHGLPSSRGPADNKDSPAAASWSPARPAPHAPTSWGAQLGAGAPTPRATQPLGSHRSAAASPACSARLSQRSTDVPRDASFDRLSRSSDRSAELSGRTPRIQFKKDEVGTYFGDGNPASALPRLPEDRAPADGGGLYPRAAMGASAGEEADRSEDAAQFQPMQLPARGRSRGRDQQQDAALLSARGGAALSARPQAQPHSYVSTYRPPAGAASAGRSPLWSSRGSPAAGPPGATTATAGPPAASGGLGDQSRRQRSESSDDSHTTRPGGESPMSSLAG